MRDTGEDPRSKQPSDDGAPKFGRLLIVLAAALLMIVAITFGSEAWFS